MDLSRFDFSSVADGGGEATLGDVFAKSLETTRLNEGRSQFSGRAEATYARESERIFGLTGVRLLNPYHYTAREMQAGNREGLTGSSFERFERRRARLAEQRPELMDEIAPWQDTLADLYADQRRVEGELADVLRRSGATVNIPVPFLGPVPLNPAAVAGGVVASGTDPFLAAQMLIGPGARTGVGVAGVLYGAAKAAAGNAAVTAAAQPFVQDWRRQAGLDYGIKEAAGNVVAAGALGFVLDAGVRTGFRGVRAAQGRAPIVDADGNVTGYAKPGETPPAPASTFDPASTPGEAAAARAAEPAAVDPATSAARVADTSNPPDAPQLRELASREGPEAALDVAAARAPEGSLLRRAAEGDMDAAAELARTTGAEADPAVRGALQEYERQKLFGPPPEVDRGLHEQRLADMLLALDDPTLPPPAPPPRPVPDTLADAKALTPEQIDARQRLADRTGTPTDLAALMRTRPELVTADLFLSDHKMAQARLLAQLSDDGFARVAEGRVRPNHAVLVARHVADAGRHAEVLDALAAAAPRNEDQARRIIGDAVNRNAALDVHMARTGASTVAPEMLETRRLVLKGGMAALKRDGRIKAIVERDAARLEAGLPDGAKGNPRLRAELSKSFLDTIDVMARADTHVAELLADAADARAAGAAARVTADAFAGRLAAAIEADGLDGLAKPRRGPPGEGARLDDPHGPEAAKQSQAIEARRVARAPEPASRFADPETGSVMDPRDVDSIVDMVRYVRETRAVPRPQSLSRWVMDNGRLRDPGGDVTSMLGGNRHLLSGRGMKLDDAARKAWEAGFIDSPDRPDINTFLDLLDRDLRGDPVFRLSERIWLEDQAVMREYENDIWRFGLRPDMGDDDVRAHFTRAGGSGTRGGAAVDRGSDDGVKFALRRGDDRPGTEPGASAAGAGDPAAGAGRGAGAGAVRRRDGTAPAGAAAARSGSAAGSPLVGPSIGRFAFADGLRGTFVRIDGDDEPRALALYVHKDKASMPSLVGGATGVREALDRANNQIARIELTERGPGRWEVDLVKVDVGMRQRGIATRLYDHIERTAGITLLPSGTLLPDGHAFWLKRNANALAHHRFVEAEGIWHSPKMLMLLERSARLAGDLDDAARYQRLLDTISPEAKTPEAIAAMFSLRDRADLTRRGGALWPDVKAKVDDVIARLPKAVRLEMSERLVYGGREVDGAWDPYRTLIRLAYSPTMDRVLRHEEIHALRELGLLTRNEWEILVAAGLRQGLFEKFDIEARYVEAYADRFAGNPAGLREALLEEMVADMWGAMRRGDKFGPAADSAAGAFRRLKDLFEAITNALRGLGFQAAEDIYRRIETGEVGRRPLDGGAMGVPRVNPKRSTGQWRRPDASKLSLPPNRLMPVPDAVRELFGLTGRGFKLDVAHIVAKRIDHARKGGYAVEPEFATPASTRAFVEATFATMTFAKRYVDGQGWNVARLRPDGRLDVVAFQPRSDGDGRMAIKTAFVATSDDFARGLRGALRQHGVDAVRYVEGDPEALRTIVDLGGRQDAARPDPRVDSALDLLRQRAAVLETPRDPAVTTRADAERMGDLADLVEACKR